tara:strand:+ start:2959 stop:3672 length:714 start_codon:yes stop_codon:yes gene_type:complete
MYSISNSKNIENITQLPDDILYNILSKCDTSSILNLNKTNKLFNFLIKNDLEDNKIIKLDSETYQIELIFYLELSENEYIKLDSSLENINNYIKLITVNYECSEPLYKDTKIILNLRMNIITYDIIQMKLNFNNFIKDYDLYDILMKREKEYELLTYITNEQDELITEYKKNNIKFMFNGIGNKNEYERIYNIINENIQAIDLKSLNNLKWLNMETVMSNKNVIKNLIGLNIDLTTI